MQAIRQAMRCGSVVALVSVVLLGFPTAPPVWGSSALDRADSGGSGAAGGEDGSVSKSFEPVGTFTPPVDDPTTHANRGFFLWPEARRMYMLLGQFSNVRQARRLAVFDMDTFEELASLDFASADDADRRRDGGLMLSGAGGAAGGGVQGAIDRAGGRLFLPYISASLQPGSELEDRARHDVTTGQFCARSAWEECVHGILVVDGRTLETRRIPIPGIGLDGVAPTSLVTVRAMNWSPAVEDDGEGKLHLLLQEHVLTDQPVGGQVGEYRKTTNTHLWYAMQIDPETGQDWVVRIEGCRNTRDVTETTAHNEMKFSPHGGMIYRSPDPAQAAVIAGCFTGTAEAAAIVRIPLDAQGNARGLPVVLEQPNFSAGAGVPSQPPVTSADAQVTFIGPDRTVGMIGDQQAGRVLLRILDGGAEVWWVFDAVNWRTLGTIGVGKSSMSSSWSGLDPDTGRLYVVTSPDGGAGDMFVADTRRSPLPQALLFPQLGGQPSRNLRYPIYVASRVDGHPPRVFVPREARFSGLQSMTVLEDHVPLSRDLVSGDEFEGRTLDLDEEEGVTSSVYDGTARGYGVRVLLVGGVDAAMRAGPVDAPGNVWQLGEYSPTTNGIGDPSTVYVPPLWPTLGSPSSPCTSTNREIIAGAVGADAPVIVDGNGSRGGAVPVALGSSMEADLEAPVSRCTGRSWDQAWSSALFGQAPTAEPRGPAEGDNRQVNCVSGSEQGDDATGDPVAGVYAAQIACADDEASGYAYARGLSIPGLDVGAALSSFRVYRDPTRGIVSRVESVARGISIPGVLRIDTVRGTAESWANGRKQQIDAEDRDAAYNPNCDHERTAGTCFRRHVLGVWTPKWSCGPCGDERLMLERLSRAIAGYGSARLRDPDPRLLKGAENGFIAAVQKPDAERFSDLVLNHDMLETVVPTLEIVRQAPPNRLQTGGGPRGRQIYQFAGVEVSSSYGVACLLVYDEAAGTCSAAKEQPGSIAVSLTDGEGKPLAGGAFEVRRDVDADGLAGLKDTLLAGGACVTTANGVGTCTFDGLPPGGYLVSQVAAPHGYGLVTEPHLVELASGEARTVTFQNTSNLSTIQVSASDEVGGPLAGAIFAAYPDSDSDGKVAPDTQPVATCETDAAGGCTMQVPAGSYVLVQAATPGGLEPIEPVAFTFASGGQTAAVAVINYPPARPGTEPGAGPAPAPRYSPPIAPVPPVDTVDDHPATEPVPQPEIAGPGLTEQLGGTIVQVIRAPGDALRLLARDPRQAVAWIASLTLLALAMAAARRRHLLVALAGTTPALACPGSPTLGTSSGGAPPGDGGPRPAGGAGPRPVAPTGPGAIQVAAFRGGDSRGPGGAGSAATAILERPIVAGGARMVAEDVRVRVSMAVANHGLALLITEKLAAKGDCELLTVTDSLESLRADLAADPPDVLIIDLNLPTEGGDDMLDLLPALHHPARVVGLIASDPSSRSLAARAYTGGVGGLVVAPDDLGNGQMAYAVRCVASGMPFYGPTVHALLADHWHSRAINPGAPAGLTRRELEIARMAASGLTRSQIAKRLVLSPGTVKTHLRTVRRKLGVTASHDTVQLRNRLTQIGGLTQPSDTSPPAAVDQD